MRATNNKTTARVGDILDKLRPYLEADAIYCDVVRVEGTVVYIEMTGTFVGDESIPMTTKMGIERRILEEIPEITAVELVDHEP